MKRTSLGSILGAASLFSISLVSYGQGKLNLNNYSGTGNQILYGGGWGVLTGTGLQNNTPGGVGTWTIGFYYALGDVTSSVTADPTTMSDPATLGGGLSFATGTAGDTTTIKNLPGGGYFMSTYDALINGWTAGVITVEVVAYNGADYASSILRGHSAAFLFTPISAGVPQVTPAISTSAGGMPGFAINLIPEPSTFTLAAAGSALFLLLHRKQNAVNF